MINLSGDAPTAMHELGHNLNLLHGGGVNTNCKPNYLSIMNYSYYMLRYNNADGDRAAAMDFSPPRSPVHGGRHNLLATLNTFALDEEPFDTDPNEYRVRYYQWDGGTGSLFGEGAIVPADPIGDDPDFNKDGDSNDSTLGVPVNRANRTDPNVSVSCDDNDKDFLRDHDDWSNLELQFRNDGDSANAAVDLELLDIEMPTFDDEIAILEETSATDLAITVATEPAAGNVHSVTPVVTNLGTVTATGVTVTLSSVGATPQDPLPAGCEHDAGNVTCRTQPSVLDVGESSDVTIDYQLNTDSTTAEITLTTRSQFNGPGNDPDPNNNTTQVTIGQTEVNDDWRNLTDFNAAVETTFSQSNTGIGGRVVAGGDVTLNSWGIGSQLDVDPERVDLMVGGALNAAGGQVSSGSITYQTQTTSTVWAPNGTISQAPPTFDITEAFASLDAVVGSWGPVAAGGLISTSNIWWTTLRFEGTDPALNVFEIEAAELQTAKAIEVRVPVGATALIKVTGTNYSTQAGGLTSMRLWKNGSYQQLGDNQNNSTDVDLRGRLLWVFPDATDIQIGPSLAWEGTIIAPEADVVLQAGMQLRGSVIANWITGNGTLRNYPLAGDVQLP